jgi:hypothetical protein
MQRRTTPGAAVSPRFGSRSNHALAQALIGKQRVGHLVLIVACSVTHFSL